MWELHNNATELYSQIKVKTVSFTLYDFYCNKKNFFNQSGLQLLLFCKFILLLFLGFTEAFYKLQSLSGCQKKKREVFLFHSYYHIKQEATQCTPTALDA